MFVCCDRCVLSVEVSAKGLISRPEKSYSVCECVCVCVCVFVYAFVCECP